MTPSLLSWKHRLAAIGLLFSLPFSALAATPQQTLDAGFKHLGDSGALRMESTFDFDISEKPYDVKQKASGGKFQVKMSQRLLPIQKPLVLKNTEARISLNGSLSGPKSELPGFSGTLSEPINAEWKIVDDVIYFRIEHLPQELIDGIKMIELDPAPMIGQWIRLDDGLSKEILGAFSGEFGGLGTDPLAMLNIDALAKNRFFQFLRLEKRETRTDGHSVMRVRLRVHPAFIAQLQKEALKTIDPKASYSTRLAQRNAINQDFVLVRRLLNGMQIVAVLDETAQTIERVEIGGKIAEPQKTCAWNVRLNRDVCKATSLLTVRYAVGMSFLKDSGQAIEAPFGALSFEQLIERYLPKPEIMAPMEFDAFGPDATSTLTAP